MEAMARLSVTLQVLGVRTRMRLEELARRPERGSEILQVVLWAAAAVALVAIVIAAITALVNREVAKIL